MEYETKIYNISDEKKRLDYIRNNTNGFQGLNEEEIKQVETNYYNDVFVVLNDGTLYFNGNLIDGNIDRIWMCNGCRLFAISRDNEIKPLQNWTSFSKYLNNDNCKYKKIITNVLHLVALTEEGKVIATTIDPCGFGIIPDNFIDVDDICFIEDEPHIIKSQKKILLYVGEMEEVGNDE